MRWNKTTFMGLGPSREPEHDLAEDIRPFGLRKMPAARDDLDARSRHQPLELARVRDREQPIVLAPYDLHRNVDAVQPLAQVRVVQTRLPGEPRHRVAVLQRYVELLGRHR